MSDRWLYGWSLGYAAVGAASLVIPLYALELGAGALLVGLMASTAAFAGVPGAILWGRLASKTGRRRPLILVSLGATALVFTVLPWLDTPVSLLVANALMWFVVSAAAPVLNVVVVEGVPTERWERRFALLNRYQGLGWLGGMGAGAAWTAAATGPLSLSTVAAHRTFLFASALAAGTGCAAVSVWYPAAITVSDRRFERVYRRLRGQRGWSAGRNVRAVPFGPNRMYWALRTLDPGSVRRRFSSALGRYLAAATLFFLGFSVFFGPLPAFLTEAGYSADEVFALYVVNSVGSAVAYGWAGDLAAERDPRTVQTGALTARGAAFPLLGVVGSLALPPSLALATTGLLLVLVGVTWAVIAVTATGLVSRLAHADRRGEALGAYTALGGFGGGVGSALGGVAAETAGYPATFAAAGALVVVAAFLVR